MRGEARGKARRRQGPQDKEFDLPEVVCDPDQNRKATGDHASEGEARTAENSVRPLR
ncbi:hypothetical protein GCM10017600_25600 [Streptosporangium carneum]|uniref:Uncharacterized protein n=1 Tax=Streptosporangium carneum TaxID=47481 RepID=A0A9W6I173_9ACTN|nr:hypothetical protein GCM10017600_25600 [Streptosporangium carneum]